MKRILSIAFFVMAAAGVAVAQSGAAPATDVLGAHLNYGRGCAGCHAPHSGAYGNGAAHTADPSAGTNALWGEDVGSLYNKVILTGQTFRGASGSTYSETLPGTLDSSAADVTGILMCLSCHDGNYATGAMMKNTVYETLPPTYGGYNAIPTLIGKDAGGYLNDHPVGSNAVIGCGGQYNWDCTVSASGGILPGPMMTSFINNYGWFVSPGVIANQPAVMCTTCHNQHLMNVVPITQATQTYSSTNTTAIKSGTSGLATGNYATMFFIIGPYNPADPNTATNQTAQFCRQCHGGESNEKNGGTAGTVF